MVTVLPARLDAVSCAAAGDPNTMSVARTTLLGKWSLIGMLFSRKEAWLPSADRRLDLRQQSFGNRAIACAGQVLAIGLQVLRQPGKNPLRHNHPDPAGLQPACDLTDVAGALGADAFAPVIVAGLEDNELCSRGHHG